MIVWRGLIEASYLEDARVGELLRQRGKTLEAIAYLIELWRSYPNTASIESDFFGLSQVVAQTAAQAFTNPDLRRELAVAGITRSELLLQSIRMIQVFLAQSPRTRWPTRPVSRSWGRSPSSKISRRLTGWRPGSPKLYPKSTYLDSFQYSEALANFHLGQYDRAIEVAQTIARATYKDAAGADQPSPNKWQALYILGQIYDARRQPGKALEYYRQVADRFSDAAGAIQSYTRKDLKVPEVSVVRSDRLRSWRPASLLKARPAGFARDRRGRRRRRMPATQARHRGRLSQYRPGRRQGLSGRPDAALPHPAQPERDRRHRPGRRHPAGRKDRRARRRCRLRRQVEVDRPAADQGRGLPDDDPGDNLYASGIVLVSPLEMEVLEEPAAGRVRITVRDARTKDFVPKVQVKVIGSETPQFISGETDLRGVFVAEGLRGWSPRSPARRPRSMRFTAARHFWAKRSCRRSEISRKEAARTMRT